MIRTLKEATVGRYHDATRDTLRAHLKTFLDAYNFASRLKTLKGRTVFEFISEKWTSEPKTIQASPKPPQPGTKQLGAERAAALGVMSHGLG